MSISHIRLKKTCEDDLLVGYRIYSFDFNKEHTWEYFGIIEINKSTGEYAHKENDLWEKNKIYPLCVAEANLEKRGELAHSKYKEYSSGRWTLNLYNFIKKSFETKTYPDSRDIIS